METGPKLSEKIDSSVNPLKYVKCNKTHIKLPYISEDEISRTINSLKNASAGWDNIPTFVVKKVSKHIIRPLTYLINKSIEQGIFPDEFKVAKVFPIYKSGDKKCISNYRPISVLSFFFKVIEKGMYNHLIDFIDDNNILSKHQFGFRKNHSTNHAGIALVDKISTALDMGKVAIGCFIDLKKAFETVNHFILINKLRKYGIHGNILEWFISYLDNRKQYVFYNGSKSNDQYISCGVPQGSILGPLLFILYINDLSNISESLTSILFADDTTVIVESDSVSDAIALMKLELIKLNIFWLQANKLTLNTTKTHYMVFDRGKKQSGNNLLTLNNKSIDYVKFTKFLGVIIDEQLNWLNPISYVKNKISKGFGIILRARKFSLKKRSRISIMPLYYFTFYIVLRFGTMQPIVIFWQL